MWSVNRGETFTSAAAGPDNIRSRQGANAANATRWTVFM